MNNMDKQTTPKKDVDNIAIGGTIFMALVVLICLTCGVWCTVAGINVLNSINNLSEWTLIDSGNPFISIDNECYPTQKTITVGKTKFDDRYVWTPDTKWDGASYFKLSDMNPNKHYSVYTHTIPFAPWPHTPNYLLVICAN
jgi:hypothetical protein